MAEMHITIKTWGWVRKAEGSSLFLPQRYSTLSIGLSSLIGACLFDVVVLGSAKPVTCEENTCKVCHFQMLAS